MAKANKSSRSTKGAKTAKHTKKNLGKRNNRTRRHRKGAKKGKNMKKGGFLFGPKFEDEKIVEFIKKTPLKKFDDVKYKDSKEIIDIEIMCNREDKNNSKIQDILNGNVISSICLTDSNKWKARNNFYRIYNAIKDDMNSPTVTDDEVILSGEGPLFSSNKIKKLDLSNAWEALHEESN